MELIKNGPKFWGFIRELRNMEGVKEGFIQQKEIGEIEHAEHMLKHNNSYWVCLLDGEPAGYVGVIDDDIRVATHPDYQGKGVAAHMINQIMIMCPAAHAKVKLDNTPSIRLFERCGFKKKYYLLERE